MLSLYSTMSSSSKPKSFLTRLVLIYCFDQSQFARPTLTQYSMAYNFFIAGCNRNNVISTEQLCVCKLQNFNLKYNLKLMIFNRLIILILPNLPFINILCMLGAELWLICLRGYSGLSHKKTSK